ncbi:MAG: type II toxin-antitoxin system RelE/ParE family toxin [Bacteroidetes bacterium]|nr:type II toxin-antitoxin system RelE/ParE family toxin [Bacteroidota bacterium]
MINSFSQLPKAEKEILEAWEWYEEQQIGLGDRFKDEVRKKIQSILNNPFVYPQKGKYREAQVDIFPFLIVFKVNRRNDHILILSVFHTSRHPKRKHKG